MEWPPQLSRAIITIAKLVYANLIKKSRCFSVFSAKICAGKANLKYLCALCFSIPVCRFEVNCSKAIKVWCHTRVEQALYEPVKRQKLNLCLYSKAKVPFTNFTAPDLFFGYVWAIVLSSSIKSNTAK